MRATIGCRTTSALLKQLGVSEIFTPGSSTQDIVQWIRQHIQPRA